MEKVYNSTSDQTKVNIDSKNLTDENGKFIAKNDPDNSDVSKFKSLLKKDNLKKQKFVYSDAKDVPNAKDVLITKDVPNAKDVPNSKDITIGKDVSNSKDVPNAKDVLIAKDIPNEKFAIKNDQKKIVSNLQNEIKRDDQTNQTSVKKKENENAFDDKIDKSGLISGMNVLNSLQSMSTNNVDSTHKTTFSQLREISTQLVDRILVSKAGLDNKQEVRITFNNNVLPGTEVIISKENKMLNVSFSSISEESVKFLTTNQLNLQNHLTSKLEMNEIKVSIKDMNHDNPNEGRSRNQRDFEEQKEQE